MSTETRPPGGRPGAQGRSHSSGIEPARLARRLAELPGVKPATAREIVDAFPTPEILAATSRDELCDFKGIGALKSQAILELARKLAERDHMSSSGAGRGPGVSGDPRPPIPVHPFDSLDELRPAIDDSYDRYDLDDKTGEAPQSRTQPGDGGDEEDVVDDIARLLGL